jgi:tetratricopeptide (TPR) repeat protein
LEFPGTLFPYVDEALKLNPLKPAFHHNKATILHRLGFCDEALELIDEAITVDPRPENVSSSLTEKANILHLSKRRKEALQTYDDVIQLNDQNETAFHNKGYVLMELARYDEAIPQFEQSMLLDPERGDLSLIGIGMAHYRMGNRAQALQSFRSAKEINPSNKAACFFLGLLLYIEKDFGSALESFIDIESGDLLEWTARGFCLNKLSRYQEAIDCFNAALEEAPHFPAAVIGRKETLPCLKQRDDEDSKQDSKKIRFQVNNYRRIELLMALELYEQALKAIDEVLEADMENMEALDRKGNALYKLGRYDEALSVLDQILEVSPTAPTVQGNRASVLNKMEHIKNAVREPSENLQSPAEGFKLVQSKSKHRKVKEK